MADQYYTSRGDFFPQTLLVTQFGAGMLYDDCKQYIQEQKLPIDILPVSTGNIDTIADKICDVSGRWQESAEALLEEGWTVSKATGNKIYHVKDQEILLALQQYRSPKINIEAEPSGASSLGIFPRLEEILGEERYQQYDLFAFINTGNGIKNTAYKNILDTIDGVKYKDRIV